MHKKSIRHLFAHRFFRKYPQLLSISILFAGVLLAGLLVVGHAFSHSDEHALSLQPEKIGTGSGVAACYSSIGLSCSGTNVYYSVAWDYGGAQSDTPNCGTAGDSNVLFGVQDGASNWVEPPQQLGCTQAGSITFSGSNNGTYYGVIKGAQSGVEFHREAFTAPACNATPPSQPSAIWGSCDSAGGAWISWNSASGATDYYPRIYTPNGNCSSGWFLAGDGHTCYKNSTGGASSAYVGNILPNTNYNIWVHSGQPYNPNSPTSGSFSCGLSGTLSVTGCTISGGSSTCAIPYSWTSSNTPNGVNITFTPSGGSESTIYPGAPSSGSNSVNWGAGLVTFKLYDIRSGTLLDTKQTTVGTSYASSGWLSAASCTIPAGQSTCNVLLSWGATNALQYVLQGAGGSYGAGQNILLPAPASASNYAQNLGPGSYLFGIAGWNGSVWQYLANANASASCAAGTSWDGSKCAAYPAAPSSLSASCNGATQVFLQWPKVSSAVKYYLRVWTPDGVCPSGWTLFTDNHTCYVDALDPAYHCSGATCTVAFPTVANKTYSSWVHSGDPVNWNAYATSGNFTCTTPNSKPVGYFDSANCATLDGWVVDPDSTAQLAYVHVYADKGSVNQKDLGTWQTNQYRGDVNQGSTGITGLVAGNHGYSVTTPNSIKDNQQHKISIFGVDNETSQEYELTLSPKYLTCAGVQTTCTTATQCPSGICYNGTCTNSCPPGYVASGGTCCPTGYANVGGMCQPVCSPTCSTGYTCTGPNVCTKNPPSITNFIVSPTRVRPGSSTKISWSSVGADSCTVAGQNKPLGQYVSNGPTSGTLVDSGPLTSETDFTLTCTNSAGSVSLTQTVFLLPVIIDR